MTGAIISLLLLTACGILNAQSTADAPEIISRAEWGARAPKSPLSPLEIKPAPYVIIHHTATPSCIMQATCQLKIRSIQKYHMDEKGWDDIGYNFLIGEDGNVYEGRGWGKSGAHSKNFNRKSIGISIIGNFAAHPPSAVAINTVKKLISYGVSINEIKDDYKLVGHRQTASTVCPGQSLYDEIKTWDHWSQRL